MKVGDLIYHRDDRTMQRGPGVVTATTMTATNSGPVECVDVYWTGQQRTICLYMPDELRPLDENR